MRVVRRIRAELGQGAGLLVGGSALGLVLLTADVMAGGLATYVDEQATEIVPGAVLGSGGSGGGSSLSGLGELGLSGAVLIIAVLVTVQATFRIWPVLLAMGTVGGGLLLVLVLKTISARPGPGESTLPDDYAGYFPSGHTATAGLCVGTACFVLVRWRGWGAPRLSPQVAGTLLGLLAASLVGVGTVVAGHHWVTDAVGGVLVTGLVLPLGFAACAVLAPGPDDVPMDREYRRGPGRS